MANGRKTLRIARLGTIDYAAALGLQAALVAARQRDAIPDTLLMLEHPHVFTLGRGADERHLVAPPPEVPVYRVSRGGEVTYHGPGQLAGYPILKLDGPDRDVHKYLRRIEQALIDALAQCGIAAERRAQLTGVWVGTRKIASIGVGIKRWVTLHGFAINVNCDLRFFDAIVPCGIAGCVMTSIAELGFETSVDAFRRAVEASFLTRFGYRDVSRADAAEVSRMADCGANACEARS